MKQTIQLCSLIDVKASQDPTNAHNKINTYIILCSVSLQKLNNTHISCDSYTLMHK